MNFNFSHRLSAAIIGTAIAIVQQQVAVPQTVDEQAIGTIAKQITVVINGQNPGSGVIISKQGNTYYVLTAKHVVATPDEYEIFTFDATKHTLDYRTVKKLPGIDLAIVQFSSDRNYPVAELGDSDAATEGTAVYISGWPHPGPVLTERIYQLTAGNLSGRPLQSLQDGYGLVYTNITRSGMSGGPVLDSQGRVIGIHGRADGEPIFNSETGQTVNVKSGFNLGIPIKTFLDSPAAASILPVSPNLAFSLTAEGDRARTGGRLSEAITYYEKALAQDGKYFSALLNLGLVKYQLGDVEGALRQWRTAIESNGKGLAPQIALIAALYGKGDREESLKMTSTILESNHLYRTQSVFPDVEKIQENLWGDRLLTHLQQVLAYFAPTKTFKAQFKLATFSQDGQTLIGIRVKNYLPTIELWNLNAGELKSTFNLNVKAQNYTISPDKQTLAIAGFDGKFTLWNLHTGELKSTLTNCYDKKIDTIYSIALSPDNRLLAVGTPFGLKIGDLRSDRLLFEQEKPEMVFSVAFSPDGQTLATSSEYDADTIKLWNVSTRQIETTIIGGHSQNIIYLVFSPDGQTLASADDGRQPVKLWDVRTGQLKSSLEEGFGPIVFSPDGQTLASGDIHLWNPRTGERKRTLELRSKPLVFSPDSKTLIGNTFDGTIQIWQAIGP